MPTHTLTDLARDVHVDAFRLTAADVGAAGSDWSVVKRTLRGGRREGVDFLEVDNGALSFSVVPTRGMGIWKGRFGDAELGWGSPVTDGPVNPAYVNLADNGGLGWLDGFDELLARCGLESNGAPYVEEAGGEPPRRATIHPLHGRIQNIPAHFVAVRVEDEAPHAITIEGRVDEARLFGPRLRLTTRITTVPGSNRIVVRDEFTNLKAQPAELEILYHWNFGRPLLEEGARFLAPARRIVPRDARSTEALGHYGVYGPPEPGFGEQVYFFELQPGEDGRTAALLRDRDGERGVVLRFATDQLPCFTLWKCTGGVADGYVTGLEPATNLPNPKPFERARGRVVTLAPGASRVAETVLEVLSGRAAVSAVEAEIAALQHRAGAPRIEPKPVEPFAPE